MKPFPVAYMPPNAQGKAVIFFMRSTRQKELTVLDVERHFPLQPKLFPLNIKYHFPKANKFTISNSFHQPTQWKAAFSTTPCSTLFFPKCLPKRASHHSLSSMKSSQDEWVIFPLLLVVHPIQKRSNYPQLGQTQWIFLGQL